MIINGLEVSSKIKEELTIEIQSLKKRSVFPCLSTILVGDNPASTIYVRNKHRACSEVGIKTKDNKIHPSIKEHALCLFLTYIAEAGLSPTKIVDKQGKTLLFFKLCISIINSSFIFDETSSPLIIN